MRKLAILFTVMAALLLSGCIQAETVINLNPDGSGVIEETVRLSNELLESMRKLSAQMSEAVADGKTKQPAPEDPLQTMMKDARSREKQYGPDVRFVSATPLKGKTMSGYRSVYAFKDINALRINQNPEQKAGKPAEPQEGAPKKEEIIRFSLVKGPVSTLTITMPEAKKEERPVAEAMPAEQPNKAEPDPAAAEMMKGLFKDMSIRVALQVNGTIIKTNATYLEKSLITLVDMHFGKVVENAKVFERLNAAQPKTIEETKALVKEIPGLKVEMNNPVVVQFR